MNVRPGTGHTGRRLSSELKLAWCVFRPMRGAVLLWFVPHSIKSGQIRYDEELVDTYQLGRKHVMQNLDFLVTRHQPLRSNNEFDYLLSGSIGVIKDE